MTTQRLELGDKEFWRRPLDERMADEVRVFAAKRGLEPGASTLLPCGGAGAVHAAAVAHELGVPDGRRALGTVALGHPAPGGRTPSGSARRGRPPASERVHRGSWA